MPETKLSKKELEAKAAQPGVDAMLMHPHYRGKIESIGFKEDAARGGWHGRLAFDLLDDWDFPRHGWAGDIIGRFSRDGLGAATEYDRLSMNVRGAVSAGRMTFLGRIEGGTSFQSELPFHDRFELGGFTRLSGLERGRLYGDDLATAAAGAQLKIATLNPTLGRSLFFGLIGEAGQAWQHEENPAMNRVLAFAFVN